MATKPDIEPERRVIDTSTPVGVNAAIVTFLALQKAIEEHGPLTLHEATETILRSMPDIRREITPEEIQTIYDILDGQNSS